MKSLKLIILFLFLFIVNQARAQIGAAAGLGAFSVAINQLSDRANQLVQQFQNTGLILEVNAASQVLDLVTNIQLAYEAELKNTAGSMSAQQQQLVAGLNSTLDNIQKHIINNLTAQLQQIANTLIPGVKTPQLTSFTGTIVSPDSSTVSINLNGNFFDIPDAGYNATITLGDSLYTNFTKTTQNITFRFKRNWLISVDSQVLYKQIKVNIPYRKTSFLFFKKKAIATFLLSLILLPKNAGAYEWTLVQMGDSTVSKKGTCGKLIWDSTDGNDHDLVQGCPVDPGWICERQSVVPHFWWAAGTEGSDWFDYGNVSTSTYIGWHYKSITHHSIFGNGTDGKISLNLDYTEYQTISVPQTTTTGFIGLKWGQSKAFIYPPAGTWKLIYHQFDGKSVEFSTVNTDNPYFKVTSGGGNEIQINTVPY